MTLLLFYLLLAILVSFLCSILEAVLLSISPSFVAAFRERHPQTGERLAALKGDVDRPLAAILSLNTIAHTIGAAGVGAQAALVFQDVSTGVVSGVLTLLILVFSEIIPKTLGASYWQSLVPFTVATLRVIIVVLYPLVWLAQVLTRLLARKDKQPGISREEISAMADIGHAAGIFEESESRILKNLIRFRSITAEAIMTPRTVVVAYPDHYTLQQVYQDPQFSKFTRVLVYQQYRDHVLGFVHKHDVLDELAKDHPQRLVTEIVRELISVPAETTLPRLFEQLLEVRHQLALVTDAYGGMAGIVTMEDVVETLLGVEIMDEFDGTRDMQAYARERWRQRAEKLGLAEQPETPRPSSENEKASAIRLGTTGGTPPPEPSGDKPT